MPRISCRYASDQLIDVPPIGTTDQATLESPQAPTWSFTPSTARRDRVDDGEAITSAMALLVWVLRSSRTSAMRPTQLLVCDIQQCGVLGLEESLTPTATATARGARRLPIGQRTARGRGALRRTAESPLCRPERRRCPQCCGEVTISP
jgi:hypothetical protein